MPLKIVRNDITQMHCDAIVNTANERPIVGRGCDTAVYNAAGYDRLLSYRKEHIGTVKEGEAFITPGFDLYAKYIIHAVSPVYRNGNEEEEQKLRSCYRNSLELAVKHGIRSIAFPLIATGSYHYPKEEGMRIAVDEINAFLLKEDMLIWLVVFDDAAARLGRKIYPGLESYIDKNYFGGFAAAPQFSASESGYPESSASIREPWHPVNNASGYSMPPAAAPKPKKNVLGNILPRRRDKKRIEDTGRIEYDQAEDFYGGHEERLAERLKHLSDTFSEYLLYLIESKGMTNAEVYKRAIVDKKTFSKIKNNRDAHPQKITAMCLCVGAMLNIDESRDLLARAGYALSPSDKRDVIFSYFIENRIYDMIELDIQLEEHGQQCLIE